jgi:hypothetical protein
MGVVEPTRLGTLGWPKPPRGPAGVVQPPIRAKQFFLFFFLFFKIWPLGVAGPPPMAMEATPDRRPKVAEATPPPNWGGLATPNEMANHPFIFFLFFIYFFNVK